MNLLHGLTVSDRPSSITSSNAGEHLNLKPDAVSPFASDFRALLAQSNSPNTALRHTSAGVDADKPLDVSVTEQWLASVELLRDAAPAGSDLEALAQAHGLELNELAALLKDALATSAHGSPTSAADGKDLPVDMPLSSIAAMVSQLLRDASAQTSEQATLDPRLQAVLEDVAQLTRAQDTAEMPTWQHIKQLLAQGGDKSDTPSWHTQPVDHALPIEPDQQVRDSELDQLMTLLESIDVSELQAMQSQGGDSQLDTTDTLDLSSLDEESQQLLQHLLQLAQLLNEADTENLDLTALDPEQQALLQQLLVIEQAVREQDSEFQDVEVKDKPFSLAQLLFAADDDAPDLQQLRSELLSKLEQNGRSVEQNTSPNATQAEQRLSQVLKDLQQLVTQQEGEQRQHTRAANVALGNSSATSSVAQAFGQATEAFKEQLQQAVQRAERTDAAESSNSERTLSLDALRRQVADVAPPSTADARMSSVQQGQTLTPQAAATREAQAQPSTPHTSAYEAARQAQQAIDILGPQAPERLRERVAVMFNTRTQAAEMRLDPPDLGRLNIRLSLNQDTTSVSFQVSTPQAREAIEQSLPRLRELLAEQGIQLADANVSEQRSGNAQQGQDGEQRGQSSQASVDIDHESEQLVSVAAPGRVAEGQVDYFV
ncbi:flagellar hook-length control protein FliK [Aliidiomarina maris]|uniref:Flagellar hook-length control protein FliK n=1 Tax=Aliidiomarina maris TaxID=531312 RepID=A0A327WSF8_9GAMM|nr:flagellar hook-length control protein FliK [Aliidiomarina maris]RAJ94613.1 flagellar hook-length control protein FliK [Aliidiomarina maris]RUO19717.1 hypothetical protein CWE07_12625 [Aliidiomarina maris]